MDTREMDLVVKAMNLVRAAESALSLAGEMLMRLRQADEPPPAEGQAVPKV